MSKFGHLLYLGDFESTSGKFLPGTFDVEEEGGSFNCARLDMWLKADDGHVSLWGRPMASRMGVVGGVYTIEYSDESTVKANTCRLVRMWGNAVEVEALQDRARARKVKYQTQKAHEKLKKDSDGFAELLDPVRARYNRLPWDLRAAYLSAITEYITRRPPKT